MLFKKLYLWRSANNTAALQQAIDKQTESFYTWFTKCSGYRVHLTGERSMVRALAEALFW